MDQIIKKNFSSNPKIVNYIQPIQLLADNIYSHRISHRSYLDLLEKFLEKGFKVNKYIQTIYKYSDLVLTVNNKGQQRCNLLPIQYQKCNDESNLRYVKFLVINLSTTRFKPSTDYHSARQMLLVDLKLGHYKLCLEAILKDKQPHRDPEKVFKQILSVPDYAQSLSYKFYFDKTVSLNEYIPTLKKFIAE